MNWRDSIWASDNRHTWGVSHCGKLRSVELPMKENSSFTFSSEFSAGFLSDLHRRKSFLVLGTMLMNVTVEINRHEQCDSHDPASTTNTFII